MPQGNNTFCIHEIIYKKNNKRNKIIPEGFNDKKQDRLGFRTRHLCYENILYMKYFPRSNYFHIVSGQMEDFLMLLILSEIIQILPPEFQPMFDDELEPRGQTRVQSRQELLQLT